MARSASEREQRLAELKKEVTRRGFDRHVSVLKDISELCAELQSPAFKQLAAHESVETIVYFPAQIQHGWTYVPRQALLFTSTGVIHLVASIWPGQDPQVSTLRACDLIYLRVTLVLLYGFIEIIAAGTDSPVRLGIEFNTVAWPCLTRPVRQLLQLSRPTTAQPENNIPYSPAVTRAFEDLPVKFSNGAEIYGLLPGQQIEALVFQPAVLTRWLHFFRKPLLANTLLLLTTDYLVIIQEELQIEQGWVLSYFPRRCILEIRNRPCAQWNEVAIQLQRREQSAQYTVRLNSETARDWHMQWLQHGGRWRDFPAEPV